MRKKNERMIEGLEDARLMVKLSIVAGVGSLILGLVVIFAGTATGWAGSDVFGMGLVSCWMTLLFSIASMICGIMSGSAARETEEKALLEKRKESVAAFNVDEDVRFTAGKSLDNYLRFAPYVVAILGALLVLIMLVGYSYGWQKRVDAPVPSNPLQAVVVTGVLMFFSLFGGAFFIGQSRSKAFRWLRPVGAWMIVTFIVMLLAGFSIIMYDNGYPKTDYYVARVLFWVFVVLGAEFIINFIVEFYRPRTIEEPRPIFESRFLALFTEPGGVMRNIADTLDYQFGFKVSSTWIYTFIERALFPLLILWIVVLWFFTAITEVGPNQVGVRECFGKIINKNKLLEPGVYLNAPWPFGKIARFSCEEIQSVMIGPLQLDKKEDPNKKTKYKKQATVLWTEAHFHGTQGMFLVASKSKSGKTNNVSSSLSYLGALVDVQYQIRKKDLIQYAYQNRDSKEMLKKIGRKVLTKYFASEPMIEIMSSMRVKVGPALKKLIQENADQEGLGVKIVTVNLLDAHPPIKDVAPAYQKVIGARQKKESMVYKAETYEAKVIPEAEVAQQRMLQEATSYRYDKIKVAEAESARFTQQLLGYQKMPHELYKLRTYLSFLEKDCADIRKFIMSANTPYQIYEFNLEEKPRLDLIDTDLGDITN